MSSLISGLVCAAAYARRPSSGGNWTKFHAGGDGDNRGVLVEAVDEEAATEGPRVAAMRRVLLAYSEHNPDVGYCQGLNFIVALLVGASPPPPPLPLRSSGLYVCRLENAIDRGVRTFASRQVLTHLSCSF